MVVLSTPNLLLPLGALAGLAAAAPPYNGHHRSQYLVSRYYAQPARAAAVKHAFDVSWDGYYRHAFPHDSLRPVTNGISDDRNGWGASAVDAFSTALVMGDWAVVRQLLDFIPTINFGNTTSEVSLFETTIRYLGGLLSAYDIMTGPLRDEFAGHERQVEVVLEQAHFLAEQLKEAFNTPSGVPDNMLLFNPVRKKGARTNGLAVTGTLVLEWTRLSDLTGNPLYGRLAQKAESYLLDPKPASGEPWPGLLGSHINITNGRFVSTGGSWGGGDDSFYEYLIKMYLYDPVRFGRYKDRWVAAAESTIKYLTSHPTTRPDLTYVAAWKDDKSLTYASGHLACFNGGNFILGGLTLDEPRFVRYGLDLVEGCYNTYASTATGIGPEGFRWQDNRAAANATNNPGPPAQHRDFYQASGFWISNGGYVLRPEVIESIYMAYRATGDPKYQDWVWSAFLAVNATTRAGSGYSSIRDVNKPGGGGFTDFQESFWFAEVLKYSYLTFAEDAPWQVQADHTNQFVFNTECHPIRLAAGYERSGYGYADRYPPPPRNARGGL